jgi:hypothetical protein
MKRLTPIKAIRAKCLDCCCGSSNEVKLCPCDGTQSGLCPLYPYRLGKNPAMAGRQGNVDALRKARKLPQGKTRDEGQGDSRATQSTSDEKQPL